MTGRARRWKRDRDGQATVQPGLRIWVGPSPANGRWFYVAGILSPSPNAYAPQIDSAVLVGFPAEAVIIPVDAWAGGLAAAVIIGALAGLLPAVRAARLSPTRALWSV